MNNKKSVGLTVGFRWENKPVPLVDYNYEFFHQIQKQNDDINFYAVDWRSIEPSGEATVVDLRTDATKSIILHEDLDLFHQLYLGKVFGEWDKVHKSLDILETLPLRVINPVETIKYAIDKQYLLDLQAKGLPVIPTKAISSSVSLDELKQEAGLEYGLAKPLDGEVGVLVHPLEEITEEIMSSYKERTKTILLQPFMNEIKDGEISMVFLGDAFSHSFIKIPPKGGFKANGAATNATMLPYTPTQKELNLGFEVRKKFPFHLDTFRLDYVMTKDGPKIMEVEAVNPCHFVENLEIYKLHGQRIGSFYRAELNK